ncbi:MAG: RNA polymerase sigma factor [Myxococcales bacterium FL481]|nr:MAG: RNA polymerase sigma factor [Myxococcales bacterium FL481]
MGIHTDDESQFELLEQLQVPGHIFFHRVDEQRFAARFSREQIRVRARHSFKKLPEDHVTSPCGCVVSESQPCRKGFAGRRHGETWTARPQSLARRRDRDDTLRHVAANGDNDLLEAARSGDHHALERLLARNRERVYRFGLKICGHPEDAEDVQQDTLLTMARTIRGFRGNASLSTWLYTIARSFCVKKRRRSKFAPRYQQSVEQDATAEILNLQHPGASPDDALLAGELRTRLEVAIRALQPHHREVLILRDVDGRSTTEVAAVVGISIAAVKSRLHRVRESIAQTLNVASTRHEGERRHAIADPRPGRLPAAEAH